jgi:hypothetical protein
VPVKLYLYARLFPERRQNRKYYRNPPRWIERLISRLQETWTRRQVTLDSTALSVMVDTESYHYFPTY